jgi:hypothetical protein
LSAKGEREEGSVVLKAAARSANDSPLGNLDSRVQAAQLDYDKPDTLSSAFKVLTNSSYLLHFSPT